MDCLLCRWILRQDSQWGLAHLHRLERLLVIELSVVVELPVVIEVAVCDWKVLDVWNNKRPNP